MNSINRAIGNLGFYGGKKVVIDNNLVDYIRVPVRWRTFKERWFSLPFNPKELFIYETIPQYKSVIIGDYILMHRNVLDKIMEQYYFKKNKKNHIFY